MGERIGLDHGSPRRVTGESCIRTGVPSTDPFGEGRSWPSVARWQCLRTPGRNAVDTLRGSLEPMQQPTPSHSTIVAVTTADDSHAAVRKRAAALGHQIGSSVILWARDASISPLESPLPTDWSGEGEQDELGARLGPTALVPAGREPLARQVGELRKDGLDAWA